jgi:predicted short-subunit dehydrogenase-like oxidoreductase (DUF2520 family)
MTSPKKPYVQLLGAGRTGTAISVAMSRAGYRFTWIGSKKLEDARALAKKIGIGRYGVGFDEFGEKAELLLLAVPDGEIRHTAAEAVSAGIIGDGTIAVHFSGALGSSELETASLAGASVMAFHPAQTFTMSSNFSTVFNGICFDMEGDNDACALGERIAADLAAVSIRLNPEQRVLSHLAMTAASNYTVSLMKIAGDIMTAAGIPGDIAATILRPLFSATALNVADIGAEKALTGPVSRGDTDVLKRHFKALESFDERYRTVFRELALTALDIAVGRGDVTPEKAEEMTRIIEGHKI